MAGRPPRRRGPTKAPPGTKLPACIEQAIAEGKIPDQRLANLGRRFEACLKVQHDQYRLTRLADVEKLPVPVVQLGPASVDPKGRSTFPAMWAAKSTTDYFGFLRAGRLPGRAVKMEAKSKRQDRVELAGKSGIQDHQKAALNRAASGGAFAAVLVLIPAGMWIVPWINWHAPPDDPERKSLNPVHLDAFGERFGTAEEAERVFKGLACKADWLGAALRRGWI